MKPLTINELHAITGKLIKSGYGEGFVAVSDDDECNGFHNLWSGYEGKKYETDYVDKKGKLTKGISVVLV